MADVGRDDRDFLHSFIVVYKMPRSGEALDQFAMRFQVPQPPNLSTQIANFGPSFAVIGSTDPKVLEGFLTEEPNFLDVWMLKQAIDRARSVCVVEIPQLNKRGSGVLIDKNLILTSFHVISNSDDANIGNIRSNLQAAYVRFGAYQREDAAAARGQTVKLYYQQPIVSFSSVKNMDFALLRVDDTIDDLKDIAPAPFDTRVPEIGSAVNILQHPKGGAMKLVLSSNGVSGSNITTGRIQYVTRTQRIALF
jgi:hypothetical protein